MIKVILYLKYITSMFVGIILAFAFAPHNFWWLAFICPTVLLHLWRNATPKEAFELGMMFGIGLFGFGLSWVYNCFATLGTKSFYAMTIPT
jgi:apolipoprotein N-acyltransferase